jgi:hypothetical protein
MISARIVADVKGRGRETLAGLKSLCVTESVASPAISLRAGLVSGGFSRSNAPYSQITAYVGARAVFEGAVDLKRDRLSAGGAVTELEARSRAALLLDNQAQPCQLQQARLDAVFDRFIAPYGFKLDLPAALPALALYTVHAGTSEWDAFAGFVRRVYGVTPYVTEGLVRVRRRDIAARPLRISNAGGDAAFTCLTREFIPYNIISSIYLRDSEGVYSTAVRNPAAAGYGVTRRRFVIPPTEYMDNRGLDANARIARSMFSAEVIVAELPGEHRGALLGRDVTVQADKLTLNNLMIAEKELTVDSAGAVTRLTLQSAVYFN